MAIKHYSTNLCEYLANTVDGKFILAGIFTNIYTSNFPHSQNMGVAVQFSGVEGDHFKIAIEGPPESDIKLLLLEADVMLTIPNHEFEQSAVIVAGMSVVTFPQPGVYHVILQDGDTKVHDFPFGVFNRDTPTSEEVGE